MNWTEEEDAVLRRLRADGLSAAMIAAEFGRSRNSVLGRCHRLGLCESGKRFKRNKPAPTRVHQFRHPKPQARLLTKKSAKLAIEVTPYVEPVEPSPETQITSLFDLTDKTCRWPIGDPQSPDFHFCGGGGADFLQDIPYCKYHSIVAINRGGS